MTDLIAPTLDNITIALFQNTNNTALIKLSAEISDRLSGVKTTSVYGVYTKPSGKTITVGFNWNASTGKYEASIPIDRYDELGTWKLQYISMNDKKDNNRTIYDGSSNEYFSPFYFIVRGIITILPASPFSIGISPKNIILEPGTSKPIECNFKYDRYNCKGHYIRR